MRSIRTYISGYYYAQLDLKEEEGRLTAYSFHDWVKEKLGYYESTAGYVNMIVAESLGFDPKECDWEVVLSRLLSKEEHTRSIKRFYALVKEFKEEQERLNS